MKNILCKIFFHRLIVTKRVRPGVFEMKRKRCKMEFGLNEDARGFIPMTDELREMHKRWDSLEK